MPGLSPDRDHCAALMCAAVPPGLQRCAGGVPAYLEYLDHARPILAEPVRVRDGQVLISDRPGSGIEWDEAAIRQLPG
jgi:L-alanine-DL-glutamate epimerase-like enolase superfamily enzyme